MPPRYFASTRIRSLTTALLISAALHAQQTTPSLAAPSGRTQQFLLQRTVRGSNPAAALQRAHSQHLALLQPQRVGPQPRNQNANLTAAWQPLGPSAVVSASYGNVSGRITSIAPDPNDATGNTIYLGTTGGGVWKSTNAAGSLSATTFTPLTDTLPVFSPSAGGSVIPSLSIGAVAVQPAANPVVLAGTGDPNDATDSYYGEGLLRSTDGGLTWTLIQQSNDGTNGHHSFLGLATAGIAFSTATPTLVVAAFSTSPQSAIVDAANNVSVPGIYASTDAGVTWQMATIYDGATIVQTPQPLGTGQVGNAVTSVVWDALRQRFYAAVRSHGYYTSSDGLNWTRLAAQPGTALATANCPVGSNGLGSMSCPLFRGVLAVQPATGDLYALTVDANDNDQGLWQDLCNASSGSCSNSAPVFASRIDNAALEVGSGSAAILQGSYDLTLNAAPAANNGTLLYAGTVDLYRCSIAAGSSACTLRNTTNALDGCNAPAMVAPAQHALATVAQASGTPIVFLGNDGGLWRSLDSVAETGSVCAATDKTHFDNLNAAIGTGGSLAEVVDFAQHPTDPNTLLAGLGANGSAVTTAASALTAWPQLSTGEGGFAQIDPNTPTDWTLSIGADINLSTCTLGSACTAANFAPPATIGEAITNNDNALIDAPNLLDPAQTSNILFGTCRVWRGPATSGATWSSANAISGALDGSAAPCSSTSALIRSLAAGGPSRSSSNAQLSGSAVIYAGLSGALDGGGTIPGHVFVSTNANTAPATWADTAIPNSGQFDISSLVVDPHDATGATIYATIMGFGVPHLYRSTNFGGTWTNLSANLPDAPANAVLPDPNDANTVYVALDTGVYVTQTISTCPTTNCWSVLGTGLPNAPVLTLAAAAQMPTGDGRLGMLRAGTYGRGIWATPLLTAASPAKPAITVSPTALTFTTQQVGTQSAAQTITVANSGNAPVIFTTPAITGDFTITSNTCTGTLAVSSNCALQIVFAPTATGARSGQLTLYANIAGGQAVVTLAGTGTAPASIVLTPTSLTFAQTTVNQTTAAQTISVANTGGTAATLQTPAITGDFSITANTCGATLAASTACAISVAFTPTAAGARSGTLSVTDSVGTQTATLTGTGQAPATDTLSPASLTFAQQQITTSSAAQQVTLTNTGDAPLTLIAASITPGDFNVVNGCGTSLAGHSSCAFSVTFTPTATGTRTATLTISDVIHSQTVAITGTGLAPPGVSLNPASIAFGSVGVGLTSTPQTLTLTNNGGLPLAISSITVSTGFVIATNTCGATLAVNAACTLQLVFSPSVAGTISGSLTLTDNAPSNTQTAALSGTGVDFTLTTTGPTSATLSSGSSAVYTLQLSSLSTLTGTVALSCTGAPTHATCTVSPTSPSLGQTVPVTVTVATGVAALAPAPQPFGPRKDLPLLALVLPLALMLRRRMKPAALLLVALTALTTLNGCGADRLVPANAPVNPSKPTPSGTYNLTVTGAADGLTHTVGLTLIVQ